MTRHGRTSRRTVRGRRRLAVAASIAVLAVTAATGAFAAGWRPSLASTLPRAVATTGTTTSPAPSQSPSPTPSPTPTPPADIEITLVAAGDVLTHEPVTIDARTADGGYDFTGEMAPVQAWVSGADLALCHLEVPVAPAGTAPSGYPRFGAPVQIVSSLASVGWDGCSTASNHSVDRGQDGVAATLDALDAAGLGHAGTARTEQEAATTQVYALQREGRTLRVAQVSATFGTNGLPVPADRPWSVELIDTAEIVRQATAARAAGADLVVASIHCCEEYVSEPTARQVEVAQDLAASGAVDLVIGHHAHVPQPIVHLDGGPRGEGMWVAYGLGNFLSNQGAHCCTARSDSGLLMLASIRQAADGPARVTGVEWSAVTMDLADDHTVQPLSQLVASGSGVGTLSAAELATRLERVTAVVGTQAPQSTTPPVPTGPAPTLARVPTG